MEDGAVVLHQAERRVRRMLHALCMNHTWDIPVPAKPDGVLVTGLAGVNLQPVTSALKSLLSSHQITTGGASNTINVKQQPLHEDLSTENFSGYPLVMLCDDLSAWRSTDNATSRMRELCTAVKFAFKSGCRVCVGLIGEPVTYRLQVNTLCREYPEFRWLLCTRRMLNIYIKDQKWHVSESCKEVLLNWISVTEELFAPDQLLDYTDIGQIVVRDVMRHLPDFETFLRLFTLSILGLISVIGTIIFLILISDTPSTDNTVRDLRDKLRHVITSQRRGKSEWTGGQDAVALLALQLNEPDWCLQDVQNQRSVDRLEINILATLARSRQPGFRELTLSRLSSYVNALHVTYLNPRDFHGLNLVALLERHVLTSAPFLKPSAFAYSQALLALCNSGVDVSLDHIGPLLRMQRPDGGFGYSLDETALALMALYCAGEAAVDEAVNSSILYMLSQRQADGSYGSTHTTALVLQALNATDTYLEPRDMEQTMSLLQTRISRDPAAKNVDIAAQLLIVMAGKNILSVHSMTDISGLGKSFMKSLESSSNRISTLHIHLSAENTQVVLVGDNSDRCRQFCTDLEKDTKSLKEDDDIKDTDEDKTEHKDSLKSDKDTAEVETLDDVELKPELEPQEMTSSEHSTPGGTEESKADDNMQQEAERKFQINTQKLVEAIHKQRGKKKRKRKKGSN